MSHNFICEQMTYGKDTTLNWNTNNESNEHSMLQIMTENRKRSREDDVCEFMPLSKRINNLHINNNLTSPPNSQSSDSNQSNGLSVENCISSPSSSSESDRRPSYDPGISSSDSRYYYDNKLLFELHLERMQRSGQQFPF